MKIDGNARIATWTFDRPARGNGLDEATLAAMEAALDGLERDDGTVTCLLVAGAPAVFSTGLDQGLLGSCFADARAFAAVIERLNVILDRLEGLPLITVACVEGACRLGGLELALACDLIIAGADARLEDGHLAYDAMPGGGATRRLPGRLGYAGALRFILFGTAFDAAAALDHGLVDEAVATGGALARGEAIAGALAALHPAVVRGVKASLRAARPAARDRTETREFKRSVIDRLIPG